jgi:membrane-anchored glycerophosphoryl diester phosphodiesterase (GDPDase)
MMARRNDITTEDLNWDPNDITVSLEGLYKFVKGRVTEAIKWYLKSKKSKKRCAILLRVISILLVSAAALIPILSQVILDKKGEQIIAPAWASVALVLAGVFVALDRFLGHSSSWIRYISTELRLQTLLDKFQVEWQCERSRWKETGPEDEQIQTMCAKAKEFIQQADKLILEETNTWIVEFQSAIKQIDALVKTKEETEKNVQ